MKKVILLIKVVVEVVVGKCFYVLIFGIDYDIVDGIGVCDYIYVEDLVFVYLKVFDYLCKGGKLVILNVGYGYGYSVWEVLDMVGKVDGKLLIIKEEGCCVGDFLILIVGVDKICSILDW